MNQNILILLYLIWFFFHFSIVNASRKWLGTWKGMRLRDLDIPPSMWLGWKISVISGLTGFAVLVRVHFTNIEIPPISIWVFILLTLVLKEGALMVSQGDDEIEKVNDIITFRMSVFVLSLLLLIILAVHLVEG